MRHDNKLESLQRENHPILQIAKKAWFSQSLC